MEDILTVVESRELALKKIAFASWSNVIGGIIVEARKVYIPSLICTYA